MMTKQMAIALVGLCTTTELKELKKTLPKSSTAKRKAVNLLLKQRRKKRVVYLDV